MNNIQIANELKNHLDGVFKDIKTISDICGNHSLEIYKKALQVEKLFYDILEIKEIPNIELAKKTLELIKNLGVEIRKFEELLETFIRDVDLELWYEVEKLEKIPLHLLGHTKEDLEETESIDGLKIEKICTDYLGDYYYGEEDITVDDIIENYKK